jgi:hypothetical protein
LKINTNLNSSILNHNNMIQNEYSTPKKSHFLTLLSDKNEIEDEFINQN